MVATSLCRLFVDSSAFIALVCGEDSSHSAALSYYKSLDKSVILRTTILVISETYTWLRYHTGFAAAARFMRFVEDAIPKGSLDVVYPGPDSIAKTHEVLLKYADQTLSYVDAFSFVVVQEEDIRDIFTFDSHFFVLRRNVWPAVQRS